MANPFTQAHFLSSAYKLSQLVPDEGVEIAFAGRSNAGKSTAINRLTRQKNLCKTSKTPGRTQLINFFALDDSHRLVDLPGYGYAKVPLKMRQHWDEVLYHYLSERQSLGGLVILVDIRRGLTDLDLALIDLVGDLPGHVLLTKADKLKQGARKRTVESVRRQLSTSQFSVGDFSALSGLGIEEFETRCLELLGMDRISGGSPPLDSAV